MTLVLEAEGLGKRYGRRQALTDCTLNVPPGRVVGLVGPNGAGKSTLLQLAWGAKLNPRWDAHLDANRIQKLGLDPSQRAGKLSGGQRAQLALTLAVAKRPELLILDEPVASLDPLARREFLQSLMEFAAEDGVSVVLSSHLVADMERVCDYLIVLAASRVQAVGEIDELLATHFRIVTARRDPDTLPDGIHVIQAEPLSLEDLVLAHMTQAATAAGRLPMTEISEARR